MARKQILLPVILPLFLAGALSHGVVLLARLATTYQALDLGASAQVVGLLSAVFSLLPVFFSVAIGRFVDGGQAGNTVVAGAICTALGCLALWLGQNSLAGLGVGTAILGMSQTLNFASLQILTTRGSTKAHRDAVLGNYSVAVSLGQAIGPLLLGVTDDPGMLLAVPVFAAVILILAALLLRRATPHEVRRKQVQPVTLREIAATRGLIWIIAIGSVAVTAQDLLLAFMPVLGEQRGISPTVIGLLLGIRATAALGSRLLFGHAARKLGRVQLLLLAAGSGGLGLLALMLPLPIWVIGLCLLVTGFGLAITLTCTISLTLSIAPPAARGTALSLRLTANRILQFSAPVFGGIIVAPMGVAGIFALMGGALVGAVAAVPRGLTVAR